MFNSVKILQITRVNPSSNSAKSAKEFSLPLTFFDIYWLKFPPVDCVYFYQLSKSTSSPSYFYSKILPRLKHSLSLALVHYIPLAGNLIWPSDSPKPIILYTPNDGISLTITESNVDNFEIVSSNRMHKAKELHPLSSHDLLMSDDKAALISLQITLREDIKKLKEMALSKLGTNRKLLHLSSFVLTLAYTATCLVKTKGGEGDRLVSIDFGVDCRNRLDPPIPITYFGDCVMCVRSSAKKARNFTDDNGFAFAIQLVSKLVEGLKKGVLDEAEKKVSNLFTSKLQGLQVILVAGAPQLNVYGLDFGLGMLKRVEIVSTDRDGAIFMTESRDGRGGIEVGFALKKHEMENFTALFCGGSRNITLRSKF
ncbi:phenolic glucoside malonyltransferase 1-like [Durio zibethinus]|uniref:Phenolic glucoside malonyltransferase 1-like n=1 Tax=Durio zibethinus TaxID=66656 RepID=A0A6P6BAD3_DURZI|nr:phenolic glucoside malonyltransferase 1-like [Durio zibethinus]